MLEEIPEYEKVSRNFDISWKEERTRKRYIPSPRHPWKQKEFLRHVPYDSITEEMLMIYEDLDLEPGNLNLFTMLSQTKTTGR